MTPYELAQVAVKALDARRAKEIRMLKTTDVTTLADYFVICSGTSNTQIKALTESVEEAMKNAGEMPDHIEGHREGTWVLSDYGCVVVHIFSPEAPGVLRPGTFVERRGRDRYFRYCDTGLKQLTKGGSVWYASALLQRCA